MPKNLFLRSGNPIQEIKRASCSGDFYELRADSDKWVFKNLSPSVRVALVEEGEEEMEMGRKNMEDKEGGGGVGSGLKLCFMASLVALWLY